MDGVFQHGTPVHHINTVEIKKRLGIYLGQFSSVILRDPIESILANQINWKKKSIYFSSEKNFVRTPFIIIKYVRMKQ